MADINSSSPIPIIWKHQTFLRGDPYEVVFQQQLSALPPAVNPEKLVVVDDADNPGIVNFQDFIDSITDLRPVAVVVDDDYELDLGPLGNGAVYVDATTKAITLTLPEEPNVGDSFSLFDYKLKFGTNNLTIDPNGKNINSSGASVVISSNKAVSHLAYIDDTIGWAYV